MSRADSGQFRDVMGRFPTGVTVVATVDDARRPVGLTVSSFTSLSLEPPLVLVCIGSGAATLGDLVRGERFAVSILASHQASVSDRFAADPTDGRFDDVVWHRAPGGSPLISEAAAWIECSLEEVLPGGDHSILIGRVEGTGVADHEPLLFHGGRYGTACT